MTSDPQFANIPLLSTFLKSFNRAYLGPPSSHKKERANGISGSGAEAEDTGTLPEDVKELVPPEVQGKMRELFVGYFNNASKTLVKGQIVRVPQVDRFNEVLTRSRNFSNRTSATMKLTSNQARSLRIANTPTSA
jgi:regulator of nonsense transcripts 2